MKRAAVIALGLVCAADAWAAYSGWAYKRPLTDANSTAIANFATRIGLTSSNFDFTHAQDDGDDFRVWDVTASAAVPYWIESWDATAQTTVIWCKPANTGNTLEIYYGKADATSESAFANVFDHGTDFSSDFGDLTQRTAGSGSLTRVAKATGWTDARYRQVWKQGEAAVKTINSGYTYERDFGWVRDLNDKVVSSSGTIVGYYAGRFADDTCDAMRTTSTDGGKTWATATVAIAHGENAVNANVAGHCTVLKFGASDYRMWYTCRSAAGQPYKIALATSTDNSTWTTYGVVLSPTDYASSVSPPDGCQVPWVTPLSDGTLVLCFEALNGGVFRVYGATSADGGYTWTPLNSQNPILGPGSSGAWDDVHAANPKIVEFGTNSYLLEYNGSPVGGDSADFGIGWATASALAGPWTRDSNNPVMRAPSATYGLETSAIAKSDDGNGLRHLHQRFSGGYQTSSIWYSEPMTVRGCIRRTEATTDAAALGLVLDSNPFVYEIQSHEVIGREVSGEHYLAILYDYNAVPAVGATTDFSAAQRVIVSRASGSHTTNKGDVLIAYVNGSNTTLFWNGSTWTTTTTRVTADVLRGVKVRLTDDGTNYAVALSYSDDGTSLASASIAKASVKAFSSGRTLVQGDIFNNAWAQSSLLEYLRWRGYAATEPSITVGAESLNGGADPVATITSGDQSVDEGDTVTLAGTGDDDEDGTLTGTALAWSSDLDGALGTGVSLDVSDLSVGEHTITLTVTDSDDNTDTDTCTVAVSAIPALNAADVKSGVKYKIDGTIYTGTYTGGNVLIVVED
jgi:hypothetical protein